MPGPPPPPGSDRRKSIRMTMFAQVELRRAEGEVFILPIVNISSGGAFLRLEGSIKGMRVGDKVTVFLDIAGGAGLTAEAEIVRVDFMGADGRPPGLAIRWSSSDPQFPEKLSKALSHLAV